MNILITSRAHDRLRFLISLYAEIDNIFIYQIVANFLSKNVYN